MTRRELWLLLSLVAQIVALVFALFYASDGHYARAALDVALVVMISVFRLEDKNA